MELQRLCSVLGACASADRDARKAAEDELLKARCTSEQLGSSERFTAASLFVLLEPIC